jgi:hypothetical protein
MGRVGCRIPVNLIGLYLVTCLDVRTDGLQADAEEALLGLSE